MKVLHVVASLSTKWGGPAKVVNDLAEILSKKGIDVSIIAPKEKDSHLYNPFGINIITFKKNFFSKFLTSYSSSLFNMLLREVNNYDLIHIHEIWHYPHYAAYKVAKMLQKPFLVTIHGSLERRALNYKKIRKKVYAMLIQKKILEKASAIHALTEKEVISILNFVDNKKIFVLPIGINPEDFNHLPPKYEIEEIYPQLKGKKTILFLGRIHPIKGLDLLANAICKILKEYKDVILLIAGPDSYGYTKDIMQILEREKANDNVIFTGMLSGREKLLALSRADIFVLPSYSEGFSMALLEAMVCCLPVIVSEQCNFPEIEKYKAGFIIKHNVNELTEVLKRLLKNDELRSQMGKNAYELAANNYSWSKIGDKIIEIYLDILNQRFTSFNWKFRYIL